MKTHEITRLRPPWLLVLEGGLEHPMPARRKSAEGVAVGVSVKLRPELLQWLRWLEKEARLDGRTASIEWCIESMQYLLDGLGLERARQLLEEERRPRGVSLAASISRLAASTIVREEAGMGLMSVPTPSDAAAKLPKKRG